MPESLRRRWTIACSGVVVFAVLLGTLVVALFPGQQSLLALRLASGVGIAAVQERIDRINADAIAGRTLAAADKAFLRDLYACFARGGRLTVVLRQSADMMDRYLARTGAELPTSSRIFVNSRPVVRQIRQLRRQALATLAEQQTSSVTLRSSLFYMGDPQFLDAFVGLYYGTITLRATRADGQVKLDFRAQMPWKWPSYGELRESYGEDQGQRFPIPNALSLMLGEEHCLMMDDGLGAYLEEIGLAKSFMVTATWEQTIVDPTR